MWREVKEEIVELVTNFTFARNLSLSIIVASYGLCGQAELQSQSRLTQQNSITNVSNSSTKVIINRK